MEKLSTLLYHSKVRSVTSKSYGTMTLSTKTSNCLAARKGVSAKDATVSSFAFFLAGIDDKKLTIGQSGSTFLIQKKGTTPKTSFRALVEVKGNEWFIIRDNTDETIDGQVAGIVAGFMATTVYLDRLPEFKSVLKMDILRKKPDQVFDALYYNLKNNIGEINIQFEEDTTGGIESAFDRAMGFEAVNAPKEIQPLLDGSETYPFVVEGGAAKAAASLTTEDAEAEEFLKRCVNGELRLFDRYFPKESRRIPDLKILNTVAPSIDFKRNTLRLYKVCCEAFGYNFKTGLPDSEKKRKYTADEMTIVLNMMFPGPPGTGKSFMCTCMGAALGLPVYQFTVTGGFEEGNFDKMPVFREGGIGMASQPFRDGFEKGGIVVIDEVNLGKPEILMMLSGALERPYLLGQETENQIKRNAATIIIATCNPGTAGTQPQNTAFYNRFKHWTEFKATTTEQLAKMVQAQRKDINFQEKRNRSVLDKILKVYEALQDGLRNKMQEMGELTTILSLRSILGVVENFYDFDITLKESITESLISPVRYFVQEKGDEDTQEEFYEKILLPILAMIGKREYEINYGAEAA